MQKERLDRFLSNQLNMPRSAVRTGIKRGLARVNGVIIKDGGYAVNPVTDNVLYSDNAVSYKKYIYIMLNLF